jgi:hypothetical protein
MHTNGEGRFDFGLARAGTYRLLIMSRAWLEPEHIECGQPACELDLMLIAAPTDLPYVHCPVQ